MTAIALTEGGVRSAKRALQAYFPETKSSHLTEALAAACGFASHAALIVHINSGDPADPDYILLKKETFATRLSTLGGTRVGLNQVPFESAAFVKNAEAYPTISRHFFEIDYQKSARKRAWRNVMVAAINAGIDRRLFSIRAGDNRWPADITHGRRDSYSFSFSIGDIPAVASVHDAGYDELSVHAALWPTEEGERVVKSAYAGFRAGEVFASGYLERRDGAWLQVSSGSHDFSCRKHRLAQIAAIEISPKGYADRGSFKL